MNEYSCLTGGKVFIYIQVVNKSWGDKMRTVTSKIVVVFLLLNLGCCQGAKLIKSKNNTLDYGDIPLYFIPNQGQVDNEVKFYATSLQYTLWLTNDGLIFDRHKQDVSRLTFLNANPYPDVIALNAAEYKVNFFLGHDEPNWKTNVQTYRSVKYEELYGNVDMKVYGKEKHIEYDWIVKPGGAPSDIRFKYDDVLDTCIDEEGNLEIKTKVSEFLHTNPLGYQIIDDKQVQVDVKFARIEENVFGYSVGAYDKNHDLIIDPLIIVHSTFLGGSRIEGGADIAVDKNGAAYVTGITYSPDFPQKNGLLPIASGAINSFVTKIDTQEAKLVYSTYIGGSQSDFSKGIAVDKDGAAYLVGHSMSTDFPLKNSLSQNLAGGYDVFVVKIAVDGSSLVYSTLIGGSDWENGNDIAVDNKGAAYITGNTRSFDFPTKNPIFGSNSGKVDAFVTKINPEGSSLAFSTYIGGSFSDYGNSIAIDKKSASYITGRTKSTDFPVKRAIYSQRIGGKDAFVTKINPKGRKLIYSTYLGGSSQDYGTGIAVNKKREAYITGCTQSDDFPTANALFETNAGGQDIFVSQLNRKGNAFKYSTFLGGSVWDVANAIALDKKGAIYLTGYTHSQDYPLWDPLSGMTSIRNRNIVTKFKPRGDALEFSTFLGGSSDDVGHGIAVDSDGNAYVTGHTTSPDFPMVSPVFRFYSGGGGDAFVIKIRYISQ